MSVIDEFIPKYFTFIDENAQVYIDRLAEAVAIQSVSADLKHHLSDIVQMMEWTKSHIDRLGGSATFLTNPKTTDEQELPPILLAEFITNPALKTVCVYGHLDVQPANLSDGWISEPFVLTERDDKLYGRGSTDDKGPALSWLWVIEAYQKLQMPLPVNIKLMYEGMEESGSDGMFEAIQDLAKPGKFLHDVDFFCISDNYWLGKTKPCLTYGLRGMAYFELEVQCAEQDLHSGVFGGTIHEGMTDLIQLMSRLVESNTGKILIPGIMDDVAPVTDEEDKLYDTIDFDIHSFKREATVHSVSDALLHDEKKSLLMARWRNPTLSLHGIEGAFANKGAKTVIPSKVKGKFSLRLVPDQKPEKIAQLVQEYLTLEFKKLQSPNKMTVRMLHGAKAWLSNPKHPNYEAAARAMEIVYGCVPDYTREGGSIPITSYLEDATKMNVLLLPVGACDDMAHSQNEKWNRLNLVNAPKVLGLYLNEIGKLSGPKPSSCRCEPLTEAELMVPGAFAFVKGFRCKCEM